MVGAGARAHFDEHQRARRFAHDQVDLAATRARARAPPDNCGRRGRAPGAAGTPVQALRLDRPSTLLEIGPAALNIDAQQLKQAAALAAGAQQYPSPALYLVATPIGNLADLSLRALHVLDARRRRRLRGQPRHRRPAAPPGHRQAADRLARTQRTPGGAGRIWRGLARGNRWPTPAMPARRRCRTRAPHWSASWSRPGIVWFRFRAPAAWLRRSASPGTSAGQGFRFAGFVPSKGVERDKAVHAACSDPGTLVWFEAPHRIENIGRRAGCCCPAATPHRVPRIDQAVRNRCHDVGPRVPGLAGRRCRIVCAASSCLVLHALAPVAQADAMPADDDEDARCAAVRVAGQASGGTGRAHHRGAAQRPVPVGARATRRRAPLTRRAPGRALQVNGTIVDRDVGAPCRGWRLPSMRGRSPAMTASSALALLWAGLIAVCSRATRSAKSAHCAAGQAAQTARTVRGSYNRPHDFTRTHHRAAGIGAAIASGPVRPGRGEAAARRWPRSAPIASTIAICTSRSRATKAGAWKKASSRAAVSASTRALACGRSSARRRRSPTPTTSRRPR